MPASIRYHVAAPDPRNHQFHIRCTVARPDPQGQTFALPAWIRGSYLVRDFSKHVIGLRAWRGKQEVAIERLDKSSFRCAAGRGALRLEYAVHAFDESVRKAYLDTRRGFFNGSSLFYAPVGQESARCDVEIEKPAGVDGWKLDTTLKAHRVSADGFGTYRADDYEDLIDHPVEMGAFERLHFNVDGIPHAAVFSGPKPYLRDLDGARLCADLKKICHVQRELFGQQPRLDRYLFLTHVTAGGYGGLEHRASTALICGHKDLPRKGEAKLSREYRTFLGLCSHEYFHLWNVKRITPQSFVDSDLAREAYTRDLWHYEGVTSYYDDLFLRRAGVIDIPAYLDLLAENATRLQRTPGRHQHTLADSSFETWIKYYQPDENSPNATVSYYIKGALVALCLDLTLRLRSAITLDTVMRALWTRYAAKGLAVPEGGLESVSAELSGLSLKTFFDDALRSTQELPLAELLAEFGIEATLRAAVSESDTGGRASGEAQSIALGLKLRPGETRVAQVLNDSAAERVGLAANDVMVALDGLRVSAANWNTRVAALKAGKRYELLWFRGEELMSGELLATTAPADTWTFTLADAKGAVLKRRDAWLSY